MQTIKDNAWLGVLAVGLVAFTIVIASRPAPQKAQTCYEKLSDLFIVTQIANATGRLPNSPQHFEKPNFSVNPDLCKNYR